MSHSASEAPPIGWNWNVDLDRILMTRLFLILQIWENILASIKYYVNTHEQSAGHAATAYARSSGKTGVCIVTSGPGLTNLVTPMLDAQNDSTPLVVLSGQVPLAAMGTQAFQECPPRLSR